MKKYLKMIGRIFGYVLVYLSTQVVVAMGIGSYYGIKYSGQISQLELQNKINEKIYIVTAISALLAFLIYILLFKGKEENLSKRCKFNKIGIKESIISLILGISSSAFCISFLNLVIEYFPSYQQTSELIRTGMTSLISLLCIVVFLPIFEEILFRGLIFNELRKNINIVIAIILQGIIFGVFHGNPLQGIYAFLLGVVLALAYYWTNSIWTAIIIHITFNIMGTMVMPAILNFIPKGIYVGLILGGVITLVLINTLKNDKKESYYYGINR